MLQKEITAQAFDGRSYPIMQVGRDSHGEFVRPEAARGVVTRTCHLQIHGPGWDMGVFAKEGRELCRKETFTVLIRHCLRED